MDHRKVFAIYQQMAVFRAEEKGVRGVRNLGPIAIRGP